MIALMRPLFPLVPDWPMSAPEIAKTGLIAHGPVDNLAQFREAEASSEPRFEPARTERPPPGVTIEPRSRCSSCRRLG
jgi:hypothetical protein